MRGTDPTKADTERPGTGRALVPCQPRTGSDRSPGHAGPKADARFLASLIASDMNAENRADPAADGPRNGGCLLSRSARPHGSLTGASAYQPAPPLA